MAQEPVQIETYTSYSQCQTLWCWAALWQGLLKLADRPLCQCRIARIIQSTSSIPCTCVPEGTTCPREEVGKWNARDPRTTQILRGVASSRTYESVTPSQVVEQLKRGLPIVAIAVCSGASHYVAITGLSFFRGRYLLEVADPNLGAPAFTTVAWSPPQRPDPTPTGWWLETFLFLESIPDLETLGTIGGSSEE